MATVIVSCYKVAKFPEGGGHFWVYMQYIQALRRAGCEVYWMERFRRSDDAEADAQALATFFERTRAFGLEGKVLVYLSGRGAPREWLGASEAEAMATLRRADLLLNFHYAIDPDLLAVCRRTALIDIDPTLLQVWISTGELSVAPHDFYFTIGETVGTTGAGFPDCGIRWIYSPPAVCLELWPVAFDPACDAFTTVSGWWSGRWIKTEENGEESLHENTKRAAFMPFVELPRQTSQPLELALDLADVRGDAEARRMLEGHGWRVRHARDVASTPEMYRAYIQRSRGEWSVAKPTYTRFQNAWVSDRTLCYLASGKPVVVQDTGPSDLLPNGAGMFRFKTVEEAAAALEEVNAHYARHCRAARELAEAHFDADKVVRRILDVTLR